MDPTLANQTTETAASSDVLMQLYMLIFLLIILAICVGAVIFFMQRYLNPEPSPVEERLQKLRGDSQEKSAEQVVEKIRKVKSYLASEYKNPAIGKYLEQFEAFLTLKKIMQQAADERTADQFFIKFIFLPFIAFFFIGIIVGFPQLILFSFLVPAGFIAQIIMKKRKRLNLFIAQFPDALAMMCSSLRAGHAFQSTLTIISTELAAPMSTEFSDVVKDINLGIPVTDALDRLLYKLDYMPDVQMFCTAVSIQREAGGNLAEVLDKLGYTIRERFKLKGQIAALTGQSRLTGYVLAAAPALLLLGLTLFYYQYVQPLYEHPIGQVALIVSSVCMVIGFIMIRKIVDIRI